MKLSAKSKYAVKFLVDLAKNDNNEYIPLSDVSERQNVSKKFLEQIVPMLVRSGLVKASRGIHGGYRLNKPADLCTVGEILRATEGDILTVDEVNYASDETIQFIWVGLHDTVKNYIDGITVQNILEHQNEFYSYMI